MTTHPTVSMQFPSTVHSANSEGQYWSTHFASKEGSAEATKDTIVAKAIVANIITADSKNSKLRVLYAKLS